MKIIVDRTTYIRGVAIEAGDKPIEIDEADARMMIVSGKAHLYIEPEGKNPGKPTGKGSRKAANP